MSAVRGLSILFTVLVLAVPARAQYTVVADRTTYVVGDTVHITVHNAGPSEAMYAEPAVAIVNSDTDTCIYGCYKWGAVLWLGVGESLSYSHDTSARPDQPGHYWIDLFGGSGDPGSILTADYELKSVVGVEATTWGHVKALYW